MKDARGDVVSKLMQAHYRAAGSTHGDGARLLVDNTVMKLIHDTSDIDDAQERNRRICFSCELVKVQWLGSRCCGAALSPVAVSVLEHLLLHTGCPGCCCRANPCRSGPV